MNNALPIHLHHYREMVLAVLKDQSHYLKLRKNLKQNPGVVTVLDVAQLFLAVFPVQCSGSCWSKSGSGPWNSGVSDVCSRSGEAWGGQLLCQLGVSWHGEAKEASIRTKSSVHCCGVWMRSMMCAF